MIVYDCKIGHTLFFEKEELKHEKKIFDDNYSVMPDTDSIHRLW